MRVWFKWWEREEMTSVYIWSFWTQNWTKGLIRFPVSEEDTMKWHRLMYRMSTLVLTSVLCLIPLVRLTATLFAGFSTRGKETSLRTSPLKSPIWYLHTGNIIRGKFRWFTVSPVSTKHRDDLTWTRLSRYPSTSCWHNKSKLILYLTIINRQSFWQNLHNHHICSF